VIIKEDEDLRDRPWGEAADLISQGIDRAVAVSEQLTVKYTIVLNEVEAIERALNNAPDNALVVILPEKIGRAIELIMARNPITDRTETTTALAAPPENLSLLEQNGSVDYPPQPQLVTMSSDAE
jgi:cyanophycin synthetase